MSLLNKLKKLLTLSFLTFFLSVPCFADYKQIDISIEPVFGLLNGSIEEYVLCNIPEQDDFLMSRLTWDVKNIYYYGADIDLNIYKYINFNFYMIKGFKKISGKMVDEDWLNPITSSWKNDDPDERTNFSEHDNYLNDYSKFQMGIGANVFLPAKLTLIPYVKLTNEYIKFVGKDGFCVYKGNKWVQKKFEGDVISYTQWLEGFLFGLSLKMETIPNTLLKFDFGFAPTTVNIDALDYHYGRKPVLLFNDKLSNAWVYEGKTKIIIKATDYFGFGVNGNLQIIPKIYGPDYVSSLSQNWAKDSSKGGTKRLFWSIELNCWIHI